MDTLTQQNPQTSLPTNPSTTYWAILVLIVLAVGAALVYHALQPQVSGPSPIVKHQETADDLQEWKTYTNTEYGFEMKLPPGWIQNKEPIIIDNMTVLINFASPKIQAGPRFKDYGGDLNLYIHPNAAKLPIKDLFSVKLGDAAKGYRAIIVAERNGLRLYDVVGLDTAQVVIIDDGKRFIEIEDFSETQIIDEVISTFKFTPPTDSSNWKTYKNEEYGFEFKYAYRYCTGNVPDKKESYVIILAAVCEGDEYEIYSFPPNIGILLIAFHFPTQLQNNTGLDNYIASYFKGKKFTKKN